MRANLCFSRCFLQNISPARAGEWKLDSVNRQPIPEFGFEPGAFRRHNISAIGHSKKLFYRNRVDGKGGSHLLAINPFLKLMHAADATHKINAFINALVFDAKQLI